MTTLFALYDPAIVWDSRSVGEIARGVYHGHEGVRRFFLDWLESFETHESRAATFSEVGDKVVVRYQVSGRGKESGVEVEMDRWNVYSVRGGLVIRVEIFASEVEAFEAAGRHGPATEMTPPATRR